MPRTKKNLSAKLSSADIAAARADSRRKQIKWCLWTNKKKGTGRRKLIQRAREKFGNSIVISEDNIRAALAGTATVGQGSKSILTEKERASVLRTLKEADK